MYLNVKKAAVYMHVIGDMQWKQQKS